MTCREADVLRDAFRALGAATDGYAFSVFPLDKPPVFSEGDAVCVLRGRQLFASGRVVSPLICDPASPYNGKHCVAYADGARFHVSPSSLILKHGMAPCGPAAATAAAAPTQVVVVAETPDYRRFTRAQCISTDVALEIG